jgi:methionyl-tRNA formyltransferase
MRIVFAGTPEFARVALQALAESEHQIIAVLTQPDRVAGRGLQISMSPVKQEALGRGLTVLQPQSLKSEKPGAKEAIDALTQMQPDLMVVAAYGLILPKEVLSIPRYGCLNIHASLLPRWRGAAPIQRAIAAQDPITGVALMQMEEGLDTGPVWETRETPISAQDNFQTVHDRLAHLGAQALVTHLNNFPVAGRSPIPQSQEGVTYANKILKSDLSIQWNQPARQIVAQISAFDPAPGAIAQLQGEPVKLAQAALIDLRAAGQPGEILKADREGLHVACSPGVLSIGRLQRPGGRWLTAREFLNGRPISAGEFFKSPAH